MVPGSARNWIAVNAAQQSSLNKKNKNKKHDNSTVKKIDRPVALATRFAFHPTLARMLWSFGGPKCFRGESATSRGLSQLHHSCGGPRPSGSHLRPWEHSNRYVF